GGGGAIAHAAARRPGWWTSLLSHARRHPRRACRGLGALRRIRRRQCYEALSYAGCLGGDGRGNLVPVSSLHSLEDGNRRFVDGSRRAGIVFREGADHSAGMTLPGRLKSPEATLKTLSTQSSGACRSALTLRPAVTPSKAASAMAPMKASGIDTSTVSPLKLVG